MMKFIDPLPVQTIAAFGGRVDIAGIIKVQLSYKLFMASGPAFNVCGKLFQLPDERDGAEILDGMYRVQP